MPNTTAKAVSFQSTRTIVPPALPKSLTAILLKEDRKALASEVDRLGDPVRGELIYRRQALACASCHAIGNVGPKIGPNLVAVGTAADTAYVVEAILEPNKAIAQHYENKLITLDDGSVLMGSIIYQSDKEVIVRDSSLGGKERKASMDKVRKSIPCPRSCRRNGRPAQDTGRIHRSCEIRFRPRQARPYANDESPVIRKWMVAESESDAPAENESWSSVYSLVNGVLPHDELGDKKMSLPGVSSRSEQASSGSESTNSRVCDSGWTKRRSRISPPPSATSWNSIFHVLHRQDQEKIERVADRTCSRPEIRGEGSAQRRSVRRGRPGRIETPTGYFRILPFFLCRGGT